VWSQRYGGGWARVRALIAASAAARDRQRTEEARARQQEQQSRLREQRFKFLVAGSAVLGVLLIAAIYFAYQANTDATQAREQFEAASAARASSEALVEEQKALASRLQTALDRLQSGGNQSQANRAAVAQIKAVADTLYTTDAAPRPPTAPVRAPRVYIHILDERDRGPAEAFKRELEAASISGANIVVPGIALVKAGPPEPALRCFQREECKVEAQRILTVANRLLRGPLELQDLSARYGTSSEIRPRHYEIWFTDTPRLRSMTAR
jgi:hypothetical protein